MKKRIICDDKYPYVDQLKEFLDCDVSLVSQNKTVRYAIRVKYLPEIPELEKTIDRYKSAMIIAIVEPIKASIYKALFPDVVIFPDFPNQIEEMKMVLSHDHDFVKEVPRFTKYENRFLSQISSGISNKEMCEVMHMSDRSVRRMKQQLMDKIGINSTLQLAIYAIYMKCRASGLFDMSNENKNAL